MDIKTALSRNIKGLLAFGPIATMLAGALLLGGTEAGALNIAAAILWSPTPIGVPGLLLQSTAAGVYEDPKSALWAWAAAGWLGALPYALL